jgi:hypothetical protein
MGLIKVSGSYSLVGANPENQNQLKTPPIVVAKN